VRVRACACVRACVHVDVRVGGYEGVDGWVGGWEFGWVGGGFGWLGGCGCACGCVGVVEIVQARAWCASRPRTNIHHGFHVDSAGSADS
jgi:hypothetical protein